LGERYTGIHTLADFSVIVIYTNWPSGIVAFLVATLASSNKISDAVAGDINLVVTLVSVNKLFGAVVRDILVATLASINRLLLTDKTRIHLRFASVRTYTFFTTGFPRFLSIRGARGLLAFNQVLI
jgi:hypothetical protein